MESGVQVRGLSSAGLASPRDTNSERDRRRHAPDGSRMWQLAAAGWESCSRDLLAYLEQVHVSVGYLLDEVASVLGEVGVAASALLRRVRLTQLIRGRGHSPR